MNGEYEYEFGVLLDAMINERHKVHDIVINNRAILEATNRVGENVLRWFALENCFEEVRMLRSLGSSIQPSALTEAVDMGNTRMVGLLLELGAEPDLDYCRSSLNFKLSKLSSRQKNIIRSHFRDYGYEL
jgi:ankyrin repeat protein